MAQIPEGRLVKRNQCEGTVPSIFFNYRILALHYETVGSFRVHTGLTAYLYRGEIIHLLSSSRTSLYIVPSNIRSWQFVEFKHATEELPLVSDQESGRQRILDLFPVRAKLQKFRLSIVLCGQDRAGDWDGLQVPWKWLVAGKKGDSAMSERDRIMQLRGNGIEGPRRGLGGIYPCQLSWTIKSETTAEIMSRPSRRPSTNGHRGLWFAKMRNFHYVALGRFSAPTNPKNPDPSRLRRFDGPNPIPTIGLYRLNPGFLGHTNGSLG